MGMPVALMSLGVHLCSQFELNLSFIVICIFFSEEDTFEIENLKYLMAHYDFFSNLCLIFKDRIFLLLIKNLLSITKENLIRK
jgi:hypothetical protein